MATSRRRQATRLDKQLEDEAWRFEFFQAVRLLERLARRNAQSPDSPRHPVGYDHRPGEEAVRFRALPSRRFAGGEIRSIDLNPAPSNSQNESSEESKETDSNRPAEMQVAFMGLTGPAGVLPEFYLDLLLRRIRERDSTMRNFFDVFNHRSISLFYRAWEKYRFPLDYERSRTKRGHRDLFTQCLLSLVGMGTAKLQGRQSFNDETLAYYGGHFTNSRPSAVSLEMILRDYFNIPVTVEQFLGRWIKLAAEDCTQLPARGHASGRHHRLQGDAVAGNRMWDVQGSFRIRLGPLDRNSFTKFLPNGDSFGPLTELTRTLVGPGLDFDVQLVLDAKEVPQCHLSRKRSVAPRLGWTTWLKARRRRRPADEPRFRPTL